MSDVITMWKRPLLAQIAAIFDLLRQSPRRGLAVLHTVTLAMSLAAISPSLAAGPIRILAFGDSLTAGYGLDDLALAFPAQLEKALREKGYDVTVIQSGVSGETTTGGRNRLDWSLAEKPDAVIIELGGNDGLRAVDPAVTRDNVDVMLAKLNDKKIPVLLAGMLAPPNLGRDYGDRFNAIYPDMAEKHGAVLYPFFLDGVAADPALNQDDRIHPNPAGVKVVVSKILPYVEKLIARVTEARAS